MNTLTVIVIGDNDFKKVRDYIEDYDPEKQKDIVRACANCGYIPETLLNLFRRCGNCSYNSSSNNVNCINPLTPKREDGNYLVNHSVDGSCKYFHRNNTKGN